MEKKEIIIALKERVDKFGADFAQTIFLREPVVIGKTDQGDVICVSYERNANPFYEYDNLVLDVLYNWKDCDLYGKDSESTPLIFQNDDITHVFISDKRNVDYEPTHKDNIEIFDNALQLVYDQAIKDGDEWTMYQRRIKDKSTDYLRMAVSRTKEQKFADVFTWEQQLEFTKIKGEIDHLMYRRPRNHDYRDYCKMYCLGEKEYRKREEEGMKRMRKILEELSEKRKN